MSQLALNQVTDAATADSQWRSLCRAGGVAALIQLACVVITIIVAFTLGAEPTAADEYYATLQNNRLVGLLRLDFTTLILLCLFAITSFGMYAALRRSNQAYAALATALIYVGMLLALANHSAFSMIRLSDQYAAATTAAQREQLLAAGEAVIASDMWNSTAGFLAGIFMQGAFVFISVVMLRGKEFSKGTAYTGILANGLDLAHVFIGLFLPSLATILLSVGGLFYLVWFPLLGRDLLRLGQGVSKEQK
jgi:hypothetical protein